MVNGIASKRVSRVEENGEGREGTDIEEESAARYYTPEEIERFREAGIDVDGDGSDDIDLF